MVCIDLGRRVAVSMIRLWNYNASRIHSYRCVCVAGVPLCARWACGMGLCAPRRGVRYVEMSLDEAMIFKGEIKRAPGGLLGVVRACPILGLGALPHTHCVCVCVVAPPCRMRAVSASCSHRTIICCG